MPKPAILPRAALILCALGLTACGPKPVRLSPLPPDLTTCADEPPAPALPGQDQQAERDRLTLDYILGLRSAWGDCRAKVDGARAWNERVSGGG